MNRRTFAALGSLLAFPGVSLARLNPSSCTGCERTRLDIEQGLRFFENTDVRDLGGPVYTKFGVKVTCEHDPVIPTALPPDVRLYNVDGRWLFELYNTHGQQTTERIFFFVRGD